MTRYTRYFVFIGLLVFFSVCISTQGFAASPDQDLQLIVRAVKNGVPVQGLSKDDFQVKVKRRQVLVKDLQTGHKSLESRPLSSPACVVLFVKSIQPDERIEQWISLIWEKIIQAGDDVILCVNENILHFENLEDKGHSLFSAIQRVQDESIRAAKRREPYLRFCPQLVQDIIEEYLVVTQHVHPHYHMKLFNQDLSRYLEVLQEYKDAYLLPELRSLKRISELVERSNKDDVWMMNLYQMTAPPALSIQARDQITKIIDSLNMAMEDQQMGPVSTNEDMTAFSKLIWKKIQAIEDVYSFGEDWPVEETIRFANENWAVVHSFFLPLQNRGEYRKDISFIKASSTISDNLEVISLNTGGFFCKGGDIQTALEQAVEKKDFFYILSIDRDQLIKDTSLEILLSDKNIELHYDVNPGKRDEMDSSNRSMLDTSKIHIDKIEYQSRNLDLKIINFFQKILIGKKNGEVRIRVVVHDNEMRIVFDQQKILYPQKTEVDITIDFKWLGKGRYLVTVEAEDLISGHSHTKSINVQK